MLAMPALAGHSCCPDLPMQRKSTRSILINQSGIIDKLEGCAVRARGQHEAAAGVYVTGG